MRVTEPNAKVIKAIESDQIKIIPERFKKTALDWLKNEYDWNISRQNWFGIKIPVYYKESNDPDKEAYIVATSEDEAKDYYGEGNYRAETDVFDTWYSSGQWPYATLMATGDFAKGFYPTSVMETGRDILTKWVTKMAMFSLYRTGQIPFHSVYLHGMINDEHGKKMSKSKGNVINPLEMTDKYGTDALRLALTIGITPGNDGSLSEAKIEGYRNFCNKLWNVARYILSQLPDDYSPALPEIKNPADAWIAARINTVNAAVTAAIEDYRFSEAGQLIYSLLWDDFADWYLEASKIHANHDMLIYGLGTILKLAHPIAPFVTEAIWSHLGWQPQQLIVTEWPDAAKIKTMIKLDANKAAEFEAARTVIAAVRSLSTEERFVKPTILTTDSKLADNAELVKRLGRIGELKLVERGTGLFLGHEAWIEASREQIEARKHRLVAQKTDKQAYLASLDQRLGNERYVTSAPAAQVQRTRDDREATLMLLSKLDEQLATLDQ